MEAEETVPVRECTGRITSRPVQVRLSNPPFTCSAMDGYAVDFERTLDADVDRPVALKRGHETFPVNTGDPIPRGTNAVIMVEEVEERPDEIMIRKPAYLWQHVRMIGEDIIQEEILLPTNHRVRLFDIGLLLGAGISEVWVRRKPRLLVIPTGKELLDLHDEPVENMGHGRLIDFNSYTLMALAEQAGFEPAKSDIARDLGSLRDIVGKNIDACDVLCINAGSSAGREDFTEQVVSELGTLVFHGVAMMPGKPTLFGLIRGKPVFGVPGYPVSAVVTFRTFVEPLYEKLCSTAIARRMVTCVTPLRIPSSVGMEEVLSVNLHKKNNQYYAYPLPRGASIFSSIARADALVRVPENVEGYSEGEEIVCELLRDESEIERRIQVVGSHDLSLDVLRDLMKIRHPDMDLISTHVGSVSGLVAMSKGIIDVSTTHILDEQEKVYNIQAIKKYLGGRPVTLIHLARRTQGLLVQRGNPKGIGTIEDLGRSGVTFVNRQVGSGTRILLDVLLRERGVDPRAIRGYEREEATHTAVGILVREGIADCGLAIYPIARIFGLDFVPITEEDYDMVVTKEFTQDPRFELLMELIRGREFTERLERLGGYTTKDTGTVKYAQG